MSFITKSNSGPDFVAKLTADVRKAYEDVTADTRAKSSEIGTLQTFAKEFLSWDKSASKQARKDLERFASMPRTEANSTSFTAASFRETFWATINSSAEEDKTRPENEEAPYSEERATAWERNQLVRDAYRRAVSRGASQRDTDDLMQAIKDAKRSKREPAAAGWQGK